MSAASERLGRTATSDFGPRSGSKTGPRQRGTATGSMSPKSAPRATAPRSGVSDATPCLGLVWTTDRDENDVTVMGSRQVVVEMGEGALVAIQRERYVAQRLDVPRDPNLVGKVPEICPRRGRRLRLRRSEVIQHIDRQGARACEDRSLLRVRMARRSRDATRVRVVTLQQGRHQDRRSTLRRQPYEHVEIAACGERGIEATQREQTRTPPELDTSAVAVEKRERRHVRRVHRVPVACDG